LGPLHYFLGIEVVRRPDGFFLHQRKYAHELLDRAGMLNCHPVTTHVDTKAKLLGIVFTLGRPSSLGHPRGSPPSLALVGRLSIGLWRMLSRNAHGYVSCFLSSHVLWIRPLLSFVTTFQLCISPPTPYIIAGPITSSSTFTLCQPVDADGQRRCNCAQVTVQHLEGESEPRAVGGAFGCPPAITPHLGRPSSSGAPSPSSDGRN
jgi:hypothetical protein